MSFQETRALPLEWFGGIDSTIPPNDLPPFSAVTAENCVFPESCVGSRPGVTQFETASSNYTAVAAGSLELVNTRYGQIVKRQLLVGMVDGTVRALALDTNEEMGVPGLRHASVPMIHTAGQFYERALVCTSGASGYGELMVLHDGVGYGGTRHARPAAPGVTRVAGAGSVTPGVHWFAVNVRYVNGSEGPLGEPISITTVASDAVDVSTSPAILPAGQNVASVSVWIATANEPTQFRRAVTIGRDLFTFRFTFADVDLQREELINDQPRLRSPKWPALAVQYAGRVCYFGERHRAVAAWKEGGSLSTDFGVGGGSYPSYFPAGWTIVAGTLYGIIGDAVYIKFDGATATPARARNLGTIRNDLVGIAAQKSGGFTASFGVRIAYQKSSGLSSGGLTFGVTGTTGSTSQAIDLGPLVEDTLYVTELLLSGTFSDDLKLTFEGVGPGVVDQTVVIYLCEVFDPANTSHRATVSWSKPLEALTIDDGTGHQTFDASDGESAMLGFKWGSRFIVAKESSLWETEASSGHPAEWPINKVCDGAGACGRRAIGHGTNFTILVNRGGCWLFQGPPVGPDGNLSREIRADWEAINWSQAWQIDVAVDELEQRIYLAVPTGTSTFNDTLYVLDYAGGFGPATANGGRRWSVWPLEARGITVGRRLNQPQAELWVPKFAGSYNRIGFLDATAAVDWGSAAIPWTYETGRIGPEDGSLALFRQVTFAAEGFGLLAPILVRADDILVPLQASTLYAPMRGTQHVLTNVKDERIGVRLTLVGASARVLLHRLTLWMRRNPFGPHRMRTP